MTIRPFRPGDEKHISELFEQVFGRPMTPAYWEWRFRSNPTGCLMIDLMWDGDLLVGHYAVSPVVLHTRRGDFPSALSMTTMTHPAYQGRGIFVDLATSLYRRLARSGIAMVWGFPNAISHRGFTRYLRWQNIYEIPNLHLKLTGHPALPAPPSEVVCLDAFDARFDDLWSRVEMTAPILSRRDQAYLQWRYRQHPENRYSILGYMRGEHLMGYAVTKPYQDVLDVVDLLADSDPEVGVSLICGAAQRAAELGLRGVNAWLNVEHPLHLSLEKMGFRNAEPITFFGGRLLTTALSPAEAYNFKWWYITMGDSDVY